MLSLVALHVLHICIQSHYIHAAIAYADRELCNNAIAAIIVFIKTKIMMIIKTTSNNYHHPHFNLQSSWTVHDHLVWN